MKKKIELENGFKCTIETNALDDMELVEMLADIEENPLLMGKVVRKVFGDEKDKLYKFLKTKDGRVPIEKVGDAIEQAFNALGEDAKN